jgi:acyl carrier protein
MMMILEKFTEIFRETFGDDSIEISESTTADDISGWDSFSHVNLILAIELAFDIEFSQREVMSFMNVGDMMAAVENKRNAA